MSLKSLTPLALLAALAPAPVLAQPVEDQRRQVRRVIVYGTDPCPPSTSEEIIVCARRPETERYRLPPGTTPPGPADRRSALERQQELREAGETGTDSCSTVGPGGQTGCLLERINRSRVGMDGDEQGSPPEGPN